MDSSKKSRKSTQSTSMDSPKSTRSTCSMSSSSTTAQSSNGFNKSSSKTTTYYCGATYHRRVEECTSSEQLYACSGKRDSLCKKKIHRHCEGKVTFQLRKIDGKIVESRTPLIAYRLHSKSCEYSSNNADLLLIAYRDRSLLWRKQKGAQLSNDQQTTTEQTTTEQTKAEQTKAECKRRSESPSNGSEQPARKELCETCKAIGDVPTIQCDCCRYWFHSQCEKVGEEKSPAGYWYCSKCRQILEELIDEEKSSEAYASSEKITEEKLEDSQPNQESNGTCKRACNEEEVMVQCPKVPVNNFLSVEDKQIDETTEPFELKKLENLVPSEEDSVGLSTVGASETEEDLQPEANSTAEQIDLDALYNLVFGDDYKQMINRC